MKGKKVYGAYSDNWNTATNPQPAKGLKVSSVSYDVKLSWDKDRILELQSISAKMVGGERSPYQAQATL